MNSEFFSGLERELDPKRKCRVAIPLAQDEACAYAVGQGLKTGALSALLIGDPTEIRKIFGSSAEHPDVTIIEERNADKACKAAVRLIRENKADILMKGLVPTSTLLKAVLNSQDGIKKNSLLSHLCFFDAPKSPGLKVLTDVAINIAPDAETMGKMAENAIEAFSLFSPKIPKVALLAANEKVSEKLGSTGLAAKTAELFRGRTDLVVEGPISFDLAVSPESAKMKKYKGKIAGDADILVTPRIETGNALYKSLQYFCSANMAGVVFGAQCPVVLTSRSDNNETKYHSLLLGIAMNRRAKNQQQRESS